MACGCKGDKKPLKIEENEYKGEGEFTLTGKLLKIPTILLLTILIIILSPLLIIIAWYISMRVVFSDDFNILNYILKNFKRYTNFNEADDEDDEEDDDFNEDDYEVVGVEIIKK